MPELILHHYDLSPFGEKVRLALGYKNLRWHSVEVPIWPPKPDLMPLTAGYRRAPVLQVGADVYCDTLLILRELGPRLSAADLSAYHTFWFARQNGGAEAEAMLPLAPLLLWMARVAAAGHGQRQAMTPDAALAAADPHRLAIRHEDPRAGTVHVHFPRLGYSIVPAE